MGWWEPPGAISNPCLVSSAITELKASYRLRTVDSHVPDMGNFCTNPTIWDETTN